MFNFTRIHRLLHTDFCPNVNPYVYWMKNPLWLLLASGAVSLSLGIFVNPSLFVVTAAILAVILLGWGWPHMTMRFVRCRVEFRRLRCSEGDAVDVKLVVENRCWVPVCGMTLNRGFATELTADGFEETDCGAALGRIPARNTSEFIWRFQPPARGCYPLTTPRLETRFPFGLSSASVEVSVAGRLIVWPRIVELRATPASLTLSPKEDRLTDRQVGDFGDFLGTRAFRRGDSLRRIHWAQSARLDQFIVCERQAACTCSVTLLPDLSVQTHSEVEQGRSATLEEALRITASLIHHFHRDGIGCEVLLGEKAYSIAARDDRGYRRVMDRLAQVPPNGLGEQVRIRRVPESGILITTDRANVRHSVRTILLETNPSECAVHQPRKSAWCRVPAGSRIADFAKLWQRACHVA